MKGLVFFRCLPVEIVCYVFVSSGSLYKACGGFIRKIFVCIVSLCAVYKHTCTENSQPKSTMWCSPFTHLTWVLYALENVLSSGNCLGSCLMELTLYIDLNWLLSVRTLSGCRPSCLFTLFAAIVCSCCLKEWALIRLWIKVFPENEPYIDLSKLQEEKKEGEHF